jgi:hypothetical protein
MPSEQDCKTAYGTRKSAALRRMGLDGEVPNVPTVLPTPRPDEEAAPEPDGPEAASRQNGGGGIRTHKPVRAPHFECGALPFCHPSNCSCMGCRNSYGSTPFCHPSLSKLVRFNPVLPPLRLQVTGLPQLLRFNPVLPPLQNASATMSLAVNFDRCPRFCHPSGTGFSTRQWAARGGVERNS